MGMNAINEMFLLVRGDNTGRGFPRGNSCSTEAAASIFKPGPTETNKCILRRH